MHVYLVLSVRRAMETLINASRRKKKLHVHVYLVLSIRRAMETLINSSRRKPTSPLSGRVLLDVSRRPVSDRLGPPTFLPSLKPICHFFLSLSRTDFPFVGSRFVRRVVTARVRSTRSADISTLSEAHLPNFSKSLAN